MVNAWTPAELALADFHAATWNGQFKRPISQRVSLIALLWMTARPLISGDSIASINKKWPVKSFGLFTLIAKKPNPGL